MAQIGTKLRALRARRGLGMRELAARSGVSPSAISLIERDRMSPIGGHTFGRVVGAGVHDVRLLRRSPQRGPI